MADAWIPSVRLRAGTVVADPSGAPGYALNVDGGLVNATWNLTYVPTIGDQVKVLMVDGSAQVLGPVGIAQRALTGTVSAGASLGEVGVTTEYGIVKCRYVGTAPTIGDLVRLDWAATTPWIWPGVVAPTTAPPPDIPVPPPPPPTIETGTTVYTAIDSGSWQVGGTWGWAGHRVIQASYAGSRENRGAWFYGDAPRQLGGRFITRAEIRVGARLHLGNYNSGTTAHFYAHSNTYRPGGDVNRVGGSHDVGIPAHLGPAWIDIPVGFAQFIVDNGGGIAIAGAPYMGFNGIDADPSSGQLRLTWSRSL